MSGTLKRVYVTGASGSGATTFGCALAVKLDALHIDTDDHYWVPTDPPFREKRSVAERLKSISLLQKSAERWVISGALESWGEELVKFANLIVFLEASTVTRLARIRERESARYGGAILPGGSMHGAHVAFLEWAEHYEHGTLPGRSRDRQEAWLASIPMPVLRLNSDSPLDQLIARVVQQV